ncbi:MAG TPA: phosphohistidine phosphatase SixA [Planctomycetota bacterium]|nr:phosphohistidine phosphatase SixA [Planctomycetota bacterium]
MRRAYLVRHGKAEEYDPDRHVGDEDRALTAEGRDELGRIARRFRRIEPKLEAVLTSPLRRARETAEIFAKAYDLELEVVRELEPPISSARLLRLVRAREERRLALVGHEPGLGQTIGRWLEIGDRAFPLKKAGIARLDVPDDPSEGPIELAWLASPELLLKAKHS